MKKLFIVSVLMLIVSGCSRDEGVDPANPDCSGEKSIPHFYGYAMLDSSAPQTRGVANKMKIWNSVMAAEELTVKFLNGTPEFQAYVKEVAGEWSKNAGVGFDFVESTKDAMIQTDHSRKEA